MRRVAALPGRAGEKEQWLGANEAKVEKLRARSVQRRASAGGYQLRHSDYGYALFDTARKSVNGRNDMSVKEIESWLNTALGR
jgi:hypothetical protein